MPAQKLQPVLEKDEFKVLLFKKLNGIKNGYYYSADELSSDLGYKRGILKLWYSKYPEIVKYRCYIQSEKHRTLIFVNPKYKAILIAHGQATENY